MMKKILCVLMLLIVVGCSAKSLEEARDLINKTLNDLTSDNSTEE